MSKLITFLYLLFLPQVIFSQNFILKHYTIEEGLPIAFSKQITQTSDGYLWIASETELYKFNGLKFERFPFNLDSADDKILEIIHGNSNDLFINSEFGVYHLQRDKYVLVGNKNIAATKEKQFIKLNEDGKLWIATNKELLLFKDEKIVFKTKFTNPDGNINSIHSFRGRLYISYPHQVFEFDTAYVKPVPILQLKDNEIRFTRFDVSGKKIFIATDHSIFQCDVYDLKLQNLKFPFQKGSQLNHLYNDNSKLIASTTTGLYIYNFSDSTFNVLNSDNGLLSNIIYKTFKGTDKDILWVSSEGGLTRLKPSFFSTKGIYRNGKKLTITSISNTSNSELLLGSPDGLFQYSIPHSTIVNEISTSSTDLLFKINGDNFSLSHDGKISILKNSSSELIQEILKNNQSVTAASFNKKELGVGILKLNDGFYLFQDNQFKKLKIKNSGNNIKVQEIISDSGKSVFVLSNRGVYKFSSVDSIVLDSSIIPVFKNENITTLLNDTKKRLWIGCYDGIVRIENNKVKKFTTDDGLNGNGIKTIHESITGEIWVLTAGGFNHFLNDHFVSYSKSQGLQTLNLSSEIYSESDKNEIVWLSSAGLVSFPASPTYNSSEFVKTEIERFLSLDQSFQPSEKIVLTYDQNYLRFEFITLSYSEPELTEYYYRMIGLDSTWVYAGKDRSTTFSDMKPGNYFFEVKSRIWNSYDFTPVTRVSFTISFPWWQRTWIKILVPILLVIIFIYLSRFYTKSKERRIEILEREVKKRTEELEKLARIDGLTKVFNRRTLDEIIDDEFERAVRFNHSLSAAFIDIDFFKKINDTYFHHVGDLVLQQLSKILLEQIRSVDQVGRYGGEEFLILFPFTDSKEAFIINERIRLAIQDFDWESIATGMKVTVSIGISNYPENAKSKAELVGLADQKLYKAKESGRNKTII